MHFLSFGRSFLHCSGYIDSCLRILSFCIYKILYLQDFLMTTTTFATKCVQVCCWLGAVSMKLRYSFVEHLVHQEIRWLCLITKCSINKKAHHVVGFLHVFGLLSYCNLVWVLHASLCSVNGACCKVQCCSSVQIKAFCTTWECTFSCCRTTAKHPLLG